MCWKERHRVKGTLPVLRGTKVCNLIKVAVQRFLDKLHLGAHGHGLFDPFPFVRIYSAPLSIPHLVTQLISVKLVNLMLGYCVL